MKNNSGIFKVVSKSIEKVTTVPFVILKPVYTDDPLIHKYIVTLSMISVSDNTNFVITRIFHNNDYNKYVTSHETEIDDLLRFRFGNSIDVR